MINNSGTRFRPSVLTIEKGSLFAALPESIEKSYVIKNRPRNIIDKIYAKFAFYVILPVRLFLNRNSVWYINTIVIAYILKYAKRFKVRCIVHTHELDHMFGLLNKEDRENLLSVPWLVIANSGQSAKVFKDHHYKNALEVLHPFIDTKKYRFNRENYLLTRKSLAISDEDFTWLMCGTIDENKNPDLFIRLAEHFSRSGRNVRFIWAGDNRNDPAYKNKCLEKSKHLTNLHWVHESGEKYLDYLNCCDGFLLTSHFESFSLVTLEALALSKPVVANDCLGVSEILNSPDIGTIIREKNNVARFVEEMTAVMNGSRIFDGEKAIARSHEFDIAKALVKWDSILTRYI